MSLAPSLGSCLGLQLLGYALHNHDSHLHSRRVDFTALRHPDYSLPLPIWLPSTLCYFFLGSSPFLVGWCLPSLGAPLAFKRGYALDRDRGSSRCLTGPRLKAQLPSDVLIR